MGGLINDKVKDLELQDHPDWAQVLALILSSCVAWEVISGKPPPNPLPYLQDRVSIAITRTLN